jgi:hypothetical protein
MKSVLETARLALALVLVGAMSAVVLALMMLGVAIPVCAVLWLFGAFRFA